MFTDYYKTLEIQQSATLDEIKIAFKKQAVKWHPDRNPNSDTTEKMQEINEAYLILKDEEARARYDIEYDKFKKFAESKIQYNKSNSDNKKEEKSPYQEYNFEDDILKKWIENARKQAIDLAKQTIKEVAELSLTATKAAGSKMFEMSIFYGIAVLIIMLLFKACL